MTRFFKVSLSVVALLLVTLVLFTGCANKALTAAEEAKQAVEDATAELEAAIAKKADADELTAKVEELTAAVEAAKALVSDGDVALKAAIDEATKALGDNAQALISALDVKIAGLLAEKADKATINEQLAKLDALVNNINEVTNGAISIKDFTELSTTVAYYAYRLEVLWEDNIVPYKNLYTDAQFTTLRKAYKNAETALYRATSMSVIEQAYANFEAVASAKENRNAIDTLYYDTVVPFFKDAAKKTTKEAYDFYISLKDTYNGYEGTKEQDIAQAAITGYYAGFFSLETTNDAATENLVAKALVLWGEKLNADVAELGNRYLVYTNSDDASAIFNTRDYIKKFNGYTPSGEEAAVAGELDFVNALPNAPKNLKAVNDTDAFKANEARWDVLANYNFGTVDAPVVGAKNAVDFITNKVLNFVFGAPAEGEDQKALADITDEIIAAVVESAKNAEGTAMPTREAVVTVNALKNYVNSWNTTFVKAPQAGESKDNMDRYAANKAPIAEVEGVVNALYNYLYREGGAVATYKAEAQQFIDLVYVPNDITAGIFDDNGVYDFAANVYIYHGDMLNEAKDLVTTWRAKWAYQDGETTVYNVDLAVYDLNKIKVDAYEAAMAIMDAQRKYTSKTENLVATWNALVGLDGKITAINTAYCVKNAEGKYVINETLPVALVYDTTIDEALGWFAFFVGNDNKKVSLDDLKYVADQLAEGTLEPTEDYYNLLNALVAKRTEMREALAAEAKALQDRLAAVEGNSLAAHLEDGKTIPAVADPAPVYDSYLVATLAADIAKYNEKYVGLSHEDITVDENTKYVLVVVETYTVEGEGEKNYLAQAEAEYDNLVALANAIKTAAEAVENAEVEGEGTIVSVDEMKDLMTAVQTAIDNFTGKNGEDVNFTQVGTDAIANGGRKIDVKAANDAKTLAETVGAKLKGDVEALANKTTAVNNFEGDDAAYIAEIKALGGMKNISAKAFQKAIDALIEADKKVDRYDADAYKAIDGYDEAYNGGVEAANKAADEAYYAAITKLVKAELKANPTDCSNDYAEAVEFINVKFDGELDDERKAERDSFLADFAKFYDASVKAVDSYVFTNDELKALVDAYNADDATEQTKAAALAAVAATQRAATVKAFQDAVMTDVWYLANSWAEVVAVEPELV